jgi:hypothetical protein
VVGSSGVSRYHLRTVSWLTPTARASTRVDWICNAGAAPVTRASGRKLVVVHPTVKNSRLAAVGYLWTFAALRPSTGARAHYDRRRLAGDRHAAAQRNLFNRFLGCLYHCLQTGQTYAEEAAFPHADALAA